MTAKLQPRIHAAPKVPLEDRLPLATPFSVHIDVSSICNFKCSFCFQADNAAMKEAGLRRGKMPLALFQKIVDDLKGFPDRVKKIKIGNHGEPTLHADLPEMIRYARRAEVADIVEVFTNGSKLAPELNAALVDAGLQRINVSIEGLSDQRYLEVAGIKQSFSAIVEGVRHLHSIKTDELAIYVKVADQSSPLKGGGGPFVLSEAERQYFLDTFGGICDEIYIEKVVPQWPEAQLNKQNSVSNTGMYDQKIAGRKDVCPFTFMYLHMNCDGSVSPCTLDWARKVVVGNAEQENVVDIWRGASLKELRVAMLEGARDRVNVCQNCSAPMVCVEEDLDPHKAQVLAAIDGEGMSLERNRWVQPDLVQLRVSS